MAVLYTPHFVQFFNDDGTPLNGGQLYTYAAGTTTPKATYTTEDGSIENANPIVLDSAGRAVIWVDGSYRFDLFDSEGTLIRSVDNVDSFTTIGESASSYFESFSGNGTQTSFTLSEDLGTDEKLIMIFVDDGLEDHVTNGTFDTDSGWTKGSGWTIGSGVATAAGAISTAIEQTAGVSLIEGNEYIVTMTITRSAGSLTPSVGGTSGTSRSSGGTYSETIIAGSTQTISFSGSGFTGTLDNVVVTPSNSKGFDIKNPNEYTLNGTSLTFTSAPAQGTNNIQVWAPSRYAGAASASASAAATSAAEALTSETNAADSEANALAYSQRYTGTSTTSLTIGTGSKAFTTQEDKNFDVGVWVLITSYADETNYMHGQVTAYSGTSLTVNVTNIGGSGTLADWTITVSGTRGATGATGDGLTSVSANDSTPGYLEGKLLVGDGLSLSTQNDGGNETRTIDHDFASQAEAEAGAATDKPMNALRTKQAIDALASTNPVVLDDIDFSGSNTYEFTDDITAYKGIEIEIFNYVDGATNGTLELELSTDGGSTWLTNASNYNRIAAQMDSSGTSWNLFNANAKTPICADGDGNYGKIMLSGHDNASVKTLINQVSSSGNRSSGVLQHSFASGRAAVAAAHNAFRLTKSGNWTGYVIVKGYK